jgi:PAS domain S-box-containing protein
MTGTTRDHKHRILVVDDEPSVLRALERIIVNGGYEYMQARTGWEAVVASGKAPPCLGLVDIYMPDQDGYTVVQALRKIPDLAHIPIIVMSGHQEVVDLERIQASGADDFIHKPFEKTDLLLRIQMHLRLRDREIRLRAITEAAQDAIILIDDAGAVAMWNRSAERMLGYNADEVLGKNVHMLIAPERFHADHFKAFEVFARSGQGAAIGKTLELPARHKDGRELVCELSLSAVQLEERWHAIGILRDITARKALEESMRKMQAEATQNQKLEAVGRLASGIAHEINTPTQFVSDSIQFIKGAFQDGLRLVREYQKALAPFRKQDPALDAALSEKEAEADFEFLLDEGPKAFARTEDGLSRIASIVRAMKEFSHPAAKEKAPADLNQALRTTLTIARNEYKYVADVETDLGELPAVPCLLGELNQVFLNLIVNAAHAIKDKVGDSGERGKITVRTRRENGYAVIAIEDNGSGIPENIRHRIFEPFFTTKEVGKGTGQGLTLARSVVVEKHQGKLDFASQTGQGTTFFIRLPLEASHGG